ncbi:beta-lactamase hydrolase domain-containing protein [Pseudoruegeria sp. SK021]|uniref:beta-lactamase hydrolase domain-containing protein n=1 Tax=Pseudoruegeria sp. SK021 TaxID=1933035 RepID=UPI000A230CC0|nr:sulfur transferase domain-containing protein [Pseudoruegeria sp. SK021]OSP53905.1 phosphatase [Pseudoruegeria sp. SK021]
MQDTVQITDRLTVAMFAPEAQHIKQAAHEGFRALVNMQTEDEHSTLKMEPQEEGRKAEEAGLTYLHHPVDGKALSDHTVDAFRRKIATLPAPVLVHCASGKRSGAFVVMHIACDAGMSGTEAMEMAEEKGVGLNDPDLKKFVTQYIERHNKAE